MADPTPLKDILLTPGTTLVLQLPIGVAGQLGKSVTLRKADERKILDMDVVGIGPGARPTRRSVTLRVPE